MAEWLSIEAYSKLQDLSVPIIQSKIEAGEIDCQRKNGNWLLKVPERDKFSAKETKQYYIELLKEKEQEILQLKEEREDMLSLLDLLERERDEGANKDSGLHHQETQDKDFDFKQEPEGERPPPQRT